MSKIKRLGICVLILSILFGNISFASNTAVPDMEIVPEEIVRGDVDEEIPEVEESEEQPEPAGEVSEEMEAIIDHPEKSGEDFEEVEAQNTEQASEEEGLTGIYYEWQTLEEVLALCEEGLNLQDFFQYTIWGFLTPELIQGLVDNGHDLDDVYEVLETGNFETSEDIMAVINAYSMVPMPMSIGDTRTAGFSGSVSSALGNIPALGSGSHGPMLRIHLSSETAFCAKFGAACRTGMVYTSVPLPEIGVDSGKERIIRGLLAQYAEAQSIYTGPTNYIMTQAGVWLVQNDQWTGDPEGMANAIAPLFSKTPDCPSVEFATNYFKAIVEWINASENLSKIEAVGLEGWANGPNQYLITATGEGGPLEELGPYARIELTKTDSETGWVIADNAEFTIYYNEY